MQFVSSKEDYNTSDGRRFCRLSKDTPTMCGWYEVDHLGELVRVLDPVLSNQLESDWLNNLKAFVNSAPDPLKGPVEEMYSFGVLCDNCKSLFYTKIPMGKRVTDFLGDTVRCTNCGCFTMWK